MNTYAESTFPTTWQEMPFWLMCSYREHHCHVMQCASAMSLCMTLTILSVTTVILNTAYLVFTNIR